MPWNPPPTISVIPRGTNIPVIAPAWGTSNVRSISGGDANSTTPSPSIGASSAPLARGSRAPLRTNATPSFATTAARSATCASVLSACAATRSTSIQLPAATSASRTMLGSVAVRICAACLPKMVRPAAGNATQNRASTRSPSGDRNTAVRSRTCWPGWSMTSSPPFAAFQFPPRPAPWSAPTDAQRAQNVRARKSHSAMLRVLDDRKSSEKPASAHRTETDMREGGAYESDWTCSTRSMKGQPGLLTPSNANCRDARSLYAP